MRTYVSGWLKTKWLGLSAVAALCLVASPASAQLTVIDFQNIPPTFTPVDSFGPILPGVTLTSSNQWIADEVCGSCFENLDGRAITAFPNGAAPLTIHFHAPAQNVSMDLASSSMGLALTIGVTGYRNNLVVFNNSFATQPVPGNFHEVRAQTMGTVDRLVVQRTGGTEHLIMDNLSFVTPSGTEILELTPPNPREFNGTPAPDGGVGVERGAFITALQTFSITGLGIEADLEIPELTLIANIYAATGLTRGPLLASQSVTFSDVGAAFYDVPINFTFTQGVQYDVAIDFAPGASLSVRFFDFDPGMGDGPYEVGGRVRVADGEATGQGGNTVLPHLRLLISSGNTNSSCEPRPTYTASTLFTDALGNSTMTIAFDGTDYWSTSGGGPNGNRLARYNASGALLGTFSPGLDFRSIFSDATGAIFARTYDSRVIRRQTSPGVFVASGITLNGGPLDPQASVVLNGAGTEYIALGGGVVSRWDLTGAFLGTVILSGFGGGESGYPEGRGIAAAGSHWLTYNGMGNLSFWDATGTRVAQATLVGAGFTDNSAFSFSHANGKVFVVDDAGGLWRGYDLCGPAGNAPTITTHPQSQTVSENSPVTFSVVAEGTPPLSYQWLKDGADIGGAVALSYTIDSAQAGDAGVYTVRVSNSFGSLLSDPATLTVTLIGNELILNALDGGWYDASGFHDPGNNNYYCGDGAGPVPPLRNWFTFSIPAVPGTITSAELRINTYSIETGDTSETYQLRHVHTPASVLQAGGSGLTDIYNDLGDGAIYGTREFFPSEAHQIISMPLNAALIADLTAAAGGTFALGGQISSLDGMLNSEAVFSSSTAAEQVQLVLSFQPGGSVIITTTNSWDGLQFINSFGEPDTATYGQTFTAPSESTLTGFTVYVDPSDNPGPIDFKFYVMAWDGQKAAGPILFESAATSTANRPDMSAYHFDTGNLQLTPGQEYVAFISAATLFDGVTGTGTMGGVSPGTYDGGIFRYLNNGSDFSAVTNQSWSEHGDWDLAFTASFGQRPGGGTVITSTNGWDGSVQIAEFGEPNTATYGQTFIAPAGGPLTSFTFYVSPFNNPDPVDFKFYVMAWDGEKATAPILFQSGTVSTFGRSGMQPYRFDISQLHLTPGGNYVAFVSASTLFDGTTGTSGMGATTPGSYDDGNFVYWNNGSDFPSLTNGIWASYPDWDLAFIAVFGTGPIETRVVRVGDATTACDGVLMVPVSLIGSGNENALGFSLDYDAALLSNPQVFLGNDASQATLLLNQTQPGRVGIALALPGGETFNTGSNELIRVFFSVSPLVSDTVTPITLGDDPITREVSDAAANVLTASYLPGSASLFAGYEADVAPRPNGHNNGSVTITDWVQVGRFAVGLDTADIGSEFQRADCAPVADCGDGAITMSDWVQAGRYAAGLDLVKRSAGPRAPIILPVMLANVPMLTSRSLRITDSTMRPNTINTVSVELDSEGDENAIGFSLAFDATRLRFEGASLGEGATGANLLVNTKESTGGRVAIALALPAGRAFAAGTRPILQARFAVAANAPSGRTTLAFGHQPVAREISDSLAQRVSATYLDGTVLITTANSPLRLHTPQRLANGAVRIFAGSQDGSPLDAARVAKIQLRVSNSLAVPVAQWSGVTSAPVLVNGLVRFDDPQGNQRQRFYAVVEMP